MPSTDISGASCDNFEVLCHLSELRDPLRSESCFGVDIEQIPVDVYILRCTRRLPQKSCVALERGFIVLNRDVASVVKRRDICALFVMKGLIRPSGVNDVASAQSP